MHPILSLLTSTDLKFLVVITSACHLVKTTALSCQEPYNALHKGMADLFICLSLLLQVVLKFHLNEDVFPPSVCHNPNERLSIIYTSVGPLKLFYIGTNHYSMS